MKNFIKLRTVPHFSYEKGLPQEGNFILGQMNGGNIIVYQAFNNRIADYAIKNQKFGGSSYSFKRMTWIKPNFLWMMYRNGWAEKENQERILAIEISHTGFIELLEQGVSTSYDSYYGNEEAWREKLQNSDVRIQWDPDHNPKGDKLKRRAVQIGIKDRLLEKFNSNFVQSIADITSFVKEQKKKIDNEVDFLVINESIIKVNTALKNKHSIPTNFASEYILNLIKEFETTGEVKNSEFEKLLINNEEKRKEIVDFIKNYTHESFSRYLLKKAIAYRKGKIGTCGCMCEDLLMFSFFVSKNGTAIDFDLIMEAKNTDFDTWCGFDGEMIFYTFGFEKTRAYLKQNIDKFSENTVDYFLDFTEEYLYNDINSRAFWYL